MVWHETHSTDGTHGSSNLHVVKNLIINLFNYVVGRGGTYVLPPACIYVCPCSSLCLCPCLYLSPCLLIHAHLCLVPTTQSCSFGLHLHPLTLIKCPLVCAGSHYLVTFIWPSFGLVHAHFGLSVLPCALMGLSVVPSLLFVPVSNT